MTEPTGFDPKKPIYATVGAGDAVVEAVADVVAKVRSRAETTRTDVTDRVEEARERVAGIPADVQEQIAVLRERLSGLPSELPEDLAELREKFTYEELRKAAEEYLKVAVDLYTDLAERGESRVEKLRTTPGIEERLGQVESLVSKVTGKAEEGVAAIAPVAAPAPAPAKKAPAKKAPAKKAAPAAKKAPAKKAPAKKAPAKKA